MDPLNYSETFARHGPTCRNRLYRADGMCAVYQMDVNMIWVCDSWRVNEKLNDLPKGWYLPP
jgi:hypothetical protein